MEVRLNPEDKDALPIWLIPAGDETKFRSIFIVRNHDAYDSVMDIQCPAICLDAKAAGEIKNYPTAPQKIFLAMKCIRQHLDYLNKTADKLLASSYNTLKTLDTHEKPDVSINLKFWIERILLERYDFVGPFSVSKYSRAGEDLNSSKIYRGFIVINPSRGVKVDLFELVKLDAELQPVARTAGGGFIMRADYFNTKPETI